MVAFTNWLLFIVGAVPFLNSLQQCGEFLFKYFSVRAMKPCKLSIFPGFHMAP